jgi:hypothetical protein
MSDDAGVRRISPRQLEQNIDRILTGDAALPETRFTGHAGVSVEQADALLKRSLNVILTDNDFRSRIKLHVPALLLMPDDPNAAPPSPDVRLISEELVNENLRVGKAIKYLQYQSLGTQGNIVRLYFQYHTPRPAANGTAYVRTGLNMTFT